MKRADKAGLGCLGFAISSVLCVAGLVVVWFNPAAGVTLLTASLLIFGVSVFIAIS